MIYDYSCPRCGFKGERNVPSFDRDGQCCPRCQCTLHRELSAPLVRVAGQPVQGGGADRFTADMLGVPLKELPSGLRTPTV